jgi:23S rRNA G2445 N2-methylase RlmL
MAYKLNVSRDVDTDEPDVFILNLPYGFRFADSPTPEHTRGYDSMRELKTDIKGNIVSCDCESCVNHF